MTPLRIRAARVAGDGVLLVGDAASFVDPLSSFGVKKALASAWLASVAVHTALADHSRDGRCRRAVRRARARDVRTSAAGAAALVARSRRCARDAVLVGASGGGHRHVPSDEWDAGRIACGRIESSAAFEELKRRAALKLRPADSLRFVERPVVRGNRVVLEEHLSRPRRRNAVRYCRNVDLVLMAQLAPELRASPRPVRRLQSRGASGAAA